VYELNSFRADKHKIKRKKTGFGFVARGLQKTRQKRKTYRQRTKAIDGKK
jgi:hypothetical protein